MTVDTRCITTCNLGTVVSGNIADGYIQGAGLVLVRGSVEIKGTITPNLGDPVTFNYKVNGGTRQLPRKLRVLSSFADPFRLTTRVELGCKLTYLSDLREEIKWDALDDPANADKTEADAEIITIPISAASVMDECLSRLGLTASSNPLTNQFSIAEFDFSRGYVNILSDLLASECFFGYLDKNETLQVVNLNQDGGSGPVVSASSIIDISGINAGQLPGEAVVVNYTTLKLKTSTPEGGPINGAEDPLSWTTSNSSQASTVAISYTSSITNEQVTNTYSTLDTTEEYCDYVVGIKASTKEKINLLRYRRIKKTQSLPSILGSVIKQFLEADIGAPAGQAETITEEYYYYDQEGRETRNTKETMASKAYAWGSVSLPVVFDIQLNGAPAKDAVAIQYGSKYLQDATETKSYYYGNIVKTVTTSYGSWMRTISGQQAVAESRDSFTSAGDVESYMDTLLQGKFLIGIVIETKQQTSSSQQAPLFPDQINQQNAADTGNPNNGYRTESESELTLAVGSATAQRRVELTLPYAPDDRFERSGTEGNYTYKAVSSDAEVKAKNYGRIQNRLLLANRSGMNIQLAALYMPEAPFSSLVVNAAGLYALYRTNGTSYTFNAEGMVASCDALYWGAIGGS